MAVRRLMFRICTADHRRRTAVRSRAGFISRRNPFLGQVSLPRTGARPLMLRSIGKCTGLKHAAAASDIGLREFRSVFRVLRADVTKCKPMDQLATGADGGVSRPASSAPGHALRPTPGPARIRSRTSSHRTTVWRRLGGSASASGRKNRPSRRSAAIRLSEGPRRFRDVQTAAT